MIYYIYFYFFTTAACIYKFLWVPLRSFVLISARVSHSLRLRKPHLARHKYIISRRKSDVKIDLLGIGILTGPGQSCRKPANSGPWPVNQCTSTYYRCIYILFKQLIVFFILCIFQFSVCYVVVYFSFNLKKHLTTLSLLNNLLFIFTLQLLFGNSYILYYI